MKAFYCLIIYLSIHLYGYAILPTQFHFRHYNIENGISANNISALLQDQKGFIWIGTDNGLSRFDGNQFTFYQKSNPLYSGLHANSINTICETNSNELWLGTENGVFIYNQVKDTFTPFTKQTNDKTSITSWITHIIQDKEGNIWIATHKQGIFLYNTQTDKLTQFKIPQNDNIIIRILNDEQNNIWLSGPYRLCRLNKVNNTFEPYSIEEETEKIYSMALWEDSAHNIWIGTWEKGLWKLNPHTRQVEKYLTGEKGEGILHIHSILEYSPELLFIGSDDGLTIFNTVTHESFLYDNYGDNEKSLSDKFIYPMLKDKEGGIWIGTYYNGVNYLPPYCGQFNGYSGSDDIPYFNSRIISRFCEGEDCLWLTTAKGLVKYTPATQETQIFTKSDGLQSEAFIMASALKTRNGEFYIGSINGFNTFYPHLLKLNTQKPNVVLTGLEIFNQKINTQKDGILPEAIDHLKEIHLSYKDNVITLNYAALSYCTPQKNQYAYILEGFDKGWNYVGSQHSTTYTNLPAGTYTFRVKASNNDNIWNEEGTSIRIIVHPPFYLSLPFKIGYVVLFLLALGLLLRYVIHRSEKKHAKAIDELNSKKEIEIHEAKINFFTMIAHEIRTPVSLIIGPLEKIMQSTHIPANERQELEIIDRNSQRLLYLVNQLLDFRKVEQKEMRMKFTSQSIKDLMQAVCERFSPTLQQNGVNFSVTYPNEHFHADVDKEAITKVLSNLLTNANKYTGSRIEVRFQEHPEKQTFSIEVKDNGKGMNEEELKKIFKPFYQASENKPGTGIGLSIVKGIVEAHHGQINVTSQPGHGSSFMITLPQKQEILSAEEEENQATNPLPEDIIPEQNATAAMSQKVLPIMLIVDDNEDMLHFLSSHFQASYTIVTAVDGVDALNKLKEQEVALIISDWMMPNMNGIDLCKAVRNNQLTSHIPFILLTAKTDTEAKITSMNCGADAYIEKPFSLQYLEACIKNLLELRLQLRQKFSQMPTVSINSIAANQSDKVFLEKMNHLIEENLNNEELSVDFLAEKLCISRSGLFVKIKGLANTTPNEMIQIIRLKKAASLLLENQYRINEVSYMVGFNNPSYFSKCFQKQFGMKPGEYIASHAHKAE